MAKKKTAKKKASTEHEAKGLSALDAIQKKWGTGAIRDLSSGPEDVQVISTGSLALNKALGIGGWPRGRIIELYGPEASGKTTLALHAVAEAQALGLKTAYIDVEHAMDLRYAESIGVDIQKILFAQPDYGEQALDIVDMLCRSGSTGLIVVDSVAALTPKAELDGCVGDNHVGLQPRMMGQALRILNGNASKSKTTILFVNQVRMKIGVMFGSPETTPGGKALGFYATIRANIRRIGAVKDGEAVIGNRTRVKIPKNKLAHPYKECEFDIKYGVGVDQVSELLDFAVTAGVVQKNGSWFSYGEAKLGQGMAAARDYLEQRPELAQEIRGKVL